MIKHHPPPSEAVADDGEGTVAAAMQLWRDLNGLAADFGLEDPRDLVFAIAGLASLEPGFEDFTPFIQLDTVEK